MALKYVSAYLMSVLGGKDTPTAEDVKEILNSVGAEIDEEILSIVMKQVEGQSASELIAAGLPRLQTIGGGASAGAATGAAGAGASQEAAAEAVQEVEEEEEEGMDFDLFD